MGQIFIATNTSYESLLCKERDEWDYVQKKTFTKWINRHLIKHWTGTEANKRIVDLFEDLRDGDNLISLLEVLSGEHLPRERGRMRVHMLQNIQIALDFLKYRKIKLVNIRPDDIVDANPKLTLGLIWTIILHYQISDIIQNDDGETYRETLLRWAQRTTEGYPGVKISDFSSSWRDGLAFNAIIHRNRPDLIDFRACRSRTVRENLESVFYIIERDLGVTRLLDPEDVDTAQPDEKSLITYISSLYELFPEPVPRNPFLEDEKLRKIEEYKDASSRLLIWITECTQRLKERNWPNTIPEMKLIQQDHNRFRTEEIPPKLREKQRLVHAYREAAKLAMQLDVPVHIDHELSSDNVEILWNRMISYHQERDQAIIEEILRLEKMQRFADKLLRDIKQCDIKLDDIERNIGEEEKRVARLNPLDAKFNCDQIAADLKMEEDRIKSMLKDVQVLAEGRYHKSTELHNRVQQLHQKWAEMGFIFQSRVLDVLAARRAEALKKPLTEEELIRTKADFKYLHDCIVWVQEKHKKIEELSYGHDLYSVKSSADQQKVEHRTIEDFQMKVNQCDERKGSYKGEELAIYLRMLNRLTKAYSELTVMSIKRLNDLETLYDFVQLASSEIKWLEDKEDTEISRDWSAKSINLTAIEQQQRQLVAEMERRETQFNSVQDRGESLIRQRHPASKCIEGFMAQMQSQWSWLLQLFNCLEVHFRHASNSQQYFTESKECEQWLRRVEEKLDVTYTRQNFSIEEGETLLREMSQLKDDITRYSQIVTEIISQSKDILPLKQRKAPLPRPTKVTSICMIKQGNATITKDEHVTLYDNAMKGKWRVKNSAGQEVQAPGTCFVIPPPNPEALEVADNLKKKYEALVSLWAKKQHKLRQNMIFATLKIVKGWDYKTYCGMDPAQRNAIIKALEDDIDKLVREGPPDDAGSKRLQEEMRALKKKFAEFDARMREEEEERSIATLARKFNDVANPLLDVLSEKERLLKQRAQNHIPRDRDSLEGLVLEHKEFETDIQQYEMRIQEMKDLFHNIPQKPAAVQTRHDSIVETWERIWKLSNLYIQRLKAVEIALMDLDDATQLISNIELRLSSQEDLPADEIALRRIHGDLMNTQDDLQRNQGLMEQLNSNVTKVRRLVEQTRPKQTAHSDVSRLEDDVRSIVRRSEAISSQIIERLRISEACGELLNSYKVKMDQEKPWIAQMSAKLNTLSSSKSLDIDAAARLYETISNRKSQIEEVNSAGERFIREAKIYDLRLKSYREGLLEVHPSVDAAKRDRRTSGADEVSQELDALNKEYSRIVEAALLLVNQLKDDEQRIQEKFYSKMYAMLDDLNEWMNQSERSLKTLESQSISAQEITVRRLETEVPPNRSVLEQVNQLRHQLVQQSPSQSTATLDQSLSRTTRRFDSVCEQIARHSERIEASKQRYSEVIGELDELLEYFRDAERQVLEAEPIVPNPDRIALLLKEIKALCDDVNSQKGRVRDAVANAKKFMRESPSEDFSLIRNKSDDLRELSNHVSQLCTDRLNALEQALPLAEHFFETHVELVQWLDEAEGEMEMLGTPALNPSQIQRQQERTKDLLQAINEHKTYIDRLNKTGLALLKLCPESEGQKVRQVMESDNDRFNALRAYLRELQNALDAAMAATSQFADKLDSMLNSLSNTAEQLNNSEPIAAHPERIKEQMTDNNSIIDDLKKKSSALEAIKEAARDVISKAGRSDEPAIREIKKKLGRLNELWEEVQSIAHNREKSLEDALRAALKFWEELNYVMRTLKELQDTLNCQEPPAIDPTAIEQQQEALGEIRQEIECTKPEVDHCRKSGSELMHLCGEPDKPEVKKHIEDLDNAWETVTSLFARREQNLLDAMEKAMNFHDILQGILEFLKLSEIKFDGLGPIASDIEAVKGQIKQLRAFKNEVDPHMVDVESLNRQAHELMENTTPNQVRAIREPLEDINRRWNDLLTGIVDRQNELESALLRLGQFQHALDELLSWITKTEQTLVNTVPSFGDQQVIEIELARLKVLTNDIHAHQTSVDTLNVAGKRLIESDQGSEDASATRSKLENLNSRWIELQNKAIQKQREFEKMLREVQIFNQEIQDLLLWLSEVDGQLVSSKPVGGLPETAREQLSRFMELFEELEVNKKKVESVLLQGQEYVKRSAEGSTSNLQHNLKTLKQRWDNILNRANDRKIKLEIALREATEFNEALQEFVEWLTTAEKHLSNSQPVSRVMENIMHQIEEHKSFQKDVATQRETMLALDKKGTHLKYFSQKQDVILIKNLLVSVQHRWERVVSKAAERSRALEHGLREAKEFHDAWTELMSWLTEAEKQLDAVNAVGNAPDKIKQMLIRHKDFQRALGSKQTTYDATVKIGRALKEKAPRNDTAVIQEMLDELKNKWNSCCAKSVDRQRTLEEALLFSGQFKDAVEALIDWLDKARIHLNLENLHGDLDTVSALVEQHKGFQEDLKSRAKNLASVKKTAADLLKSATPEDASIIRSQISSLESKWDEISRLSEKKSLRLDDALAQAEKLHKSVHTLLEWLSDAEMKLRFAGPLPDDETATRQQIAEHERFLKEMSKQELNKDATIELAQDILSKCHPDAVSVIKHWISIIQSRWDEVFAWSKQRESRLRDHLSSLSDIMDMLEELLAWLMRAEASLLAAESLPIPDDIPTIERLIDEHQHFIDEMTKRQPDVERVAKAFSSKRQPAKGGKDDKSSAKGGASGRSGPGQRSSTPTGRGGHAVEPEIKNPRARELMEKWRSVWILAMDRMRRLQDKLAYMNELERVKNFDFNEWRRRFLGWTNSKKARVMDFFRKIDKDNDGKMTQTDFIEGFLSSSFPTSRLEMQRVAPIFDRNSDGFVDHKEYLETLRANDLPQTEAEIIQDEVQRQVSKCTCVHRYKVFQVGEGKYRFGESQKLRLVRILRSTVMVRVGGGWASLDEFLLKNDPCRAKGRTNVELRENFVLADGVSQSMTPFVSKSRAQVTATAYAGKTTTVTLPSSGPITKIRVKTERSVPMSQQRRFGGSTSDISFGETDSGIKSRPRSRLTAASPTSRSGSRPSSRPGSRANSDLSTDSVDGYNQRKTAARPKFSSTPTGMRRTPSGGAANGVNGRERWK